MRGPSGIAGGREAAEQAIAANPRIVTDVRANRAFLVRVGRLFTGLDLVEPGVLQPQQWRPEPGMLSPPQVTAWGRVARKR